MKRIGYKTLFAIYQLKLLIFKNLFDRWWGYPDFRTDLPSDAT